jgi:hypothetical protein
MQCHAENDGRVKLVAMLNYCSIQRRWEKEENYQHVLLLIGAGAVFGVRKFKDGLFVHSMFDTPPTVQLMVEVIYQSLARMSWN